MDIRMDRIINIYIDNFKSLSKVSIPFPDSQENTTLCLIGKNGSGKSTILQAVDFVGELFRGDISSWLYSRQMDKSDLYPCRRVHNINIKIEGVFGGEKTVWEGSFNLHDMVCTKEILTINDDIEFSLINGEKFFKNESFVKRWYWYQGSMLSAFNDKMLNNCALRPFISFMRDIHSFDVLNIAQMRARTGRVPKGTNIGREGALVSGKIGSISAEQRAELLSKIQLFYPWIQDIRTTRLQIGWFKIDFIEKTGNGTVWKDNPINLSDSALRIIGFLLELMTSDTVVAFDEVENGLDVDRLKQFVNEIMNNRKQVIMTTHNPLVINAMPEDVALQSTLFVYRNSEGRTCVKPFFAIPDVAERLSYLSPGEVYLDVNMDELACTLSSQETVQ